MRTICVDAGNTFIKIALMEDGDVTSLAAFPLTDAYSLLQHVASLPQVDACILSSVISILPKIVDVFKQKASYFMELTHETPLPIHNLYQTPETLGKDRLAAIVGAYSLFPGKDILVFDAGTALTIDFIDSEGNFRGGNISPGLNMRFCALHEDTQKLPLMSQSDNYELMGSTTASAIISGVQNGIIFEMNCYVHHFVNKFPTLVKILTGGDINFFVNKFKMRIFAEPNLVFIGLDNIVNFNLKKIENKLYE